MEFAIATKGSPVKYCPSQNLIASRFSCQPGTCRKEKSKNTRENSQIYGLAAARNSRHVHQTMWPAQFTSGMKNILSTKSAAWYCKCHNTWLYHVVSLECLGSSVRFFSSNLVSKKRNSFFPRDFMRKKIFDFFSVPIPVLANVRELNLRFQQIKTANFDVELWISNEVQTNKKCFSTNELVRFSAGLCSRELVDTFE
jgi:hypothetical protein